MPHILRDFLVLVLNPRGVISSVRVGFQTKPNWTESILLKPDPIRVGSVFGFLFLFFLFFLWFKRDLLLVIQKRWWKSESKSTFQPSKSKSTSIKYRDENQIPLPSKPTFKIKNRDENQNPPSKSKSTSIKTPSKLKPDMKEKGGRRRGSVLHLVAAAVDLVCPRRRLWGEREGREGLQDLFYTSSLPLL